MAEPEQSRHLAAGRIIVPAFFALLVLATVGAFAVAQRLKREPLILDKVVISPSVNGRTVITPNGDGRADAAHIRFRLTRSDRGIVQIVDRHERATKTFTVKILSKRNRVVRRIPPGGRLLSYKIYGVRWNGRDDHGRLAHPGPYRLRVRLLGEGRTLIPGERIRLHTLLRAQRGQAR